MQATPPPTSPAAPAPDNGIRASGTYTLDELKRAARKRPGQWKRQLIFLFFLCAVIAFVFFSVSTPRGRATASVAIIISILYAYWLIRKQWERSWTSNAMLRSHRNLRFDSTGVHIVIDLPLGDQTTAFTAWSRFSSITFEKSRAILWTAANIFVLIPRRFFLDDDAWQKFTALASDRVGSASATRSEAAATPPPAADHDVHAINCEGTYTIDDYRAALRLYPRARSRMSQRFWESPVIRGIFISVLATVLAIFIAVLIAALTQPNQPPELFPFGLFTALVLSLVLWARWRVRAHFRRLQLGEHQTCATLSPARLIVQRDESHNDLAWSSVSSLVLTSRMILLNLGHSSFVMLPRRFFSSDESWLAARNVAYRNAGTCHKCGYLLRNSTGDACPECGSAIQAPDYYDSRWMK